MTKTTDFSEDIRSIQIHAFTIALELVEFADNKEAAAISLRHMIQTLTDKKD